MRGENTCKVKSCVSKKLHNCITDQKKKKKKIFTGWCKVKTERKDKVGKDKKNKTKDWKKS